MTDGGEGRAEATGGTLAVVRRNENVASVYSVEPVESDAGRAFIMGFGPRKGAKRGFRGHFVGRVERGHKGKTVDMSRTPAAILALVEDGIIV